MIISSIPNNVYDIRRWAAKFDYFKVVHCFRDVNRIPDASAKIGHSIWYERFPREVFRIVSNDVSRCSFAGFFLSIVIKYLFTKIVDMHIKKKLLKTHYKGF